MKVIKHIKPLKQFSMRRPSIYQTLSLQQKYNVVALIDRVGMSYATVAKKYRINPCTVRYIYLKFTREGTLEDRRAANSGRPLAKKTVEVTEIVK